MAKATLKLMPDYECYPLWLTDGNRFENIDTSDLPISDALKYLLKKWQDGYESIYNPDDPARSGFKSHAEKKEFVADGALIYKMLLDELKDSFELLYFDILSGKVCKSLNELPSYG